MGMSSRDQIMASIADAITPLIAELILRHDKAQPKYRLSDLRDQDERAVFIADVMELLSPERVAERMVRFDIVRSHNNAKREQEQQSVEAQARQDVARFAFKSGCCHICGDRVFTNRATLHLSASVITEIHGLCAAKDESRFEFVNEFIYRVRESQRGQ